MSRTVLHVTEASGSGVLHAMSSLVASQLANGWTVHVILALRDESPEILALEALFDGATVETLPAQGRLGCLRALSTATSAAARRLSPDVIHLHSTWAGLVGRTTSVGRRRRTVVYSPHGWAFFRMDVPAPLRAVFRFLELVLPVGTAGVVAVSESEGAATPRLPGARVAVVENAVRSGRVTASGRCGAGPVTVISSGRIVDQKAPWVFGRLAQALGDRVHATWVGDGPPEDRADWLEAGGVEVTGWLPPSTVLDRLAGSDVFVLASKWEGMPMALIEAQLQGLPVVATNVVGNKDVIVHGVTGFLADTEAELHRLVVALVADPDLRARIGEAAAVSARERFGLQRQSASVAAAYSALTGAAPGPARSVRVVVLNVYSARNRGDGLLAELAVAMCRDAFGADVTCMIAAHDPASFSDTDFGSPVEVLSPFGTDRGPLVAARGALTLLTAGRLGFSRAFRAATRDADVLVSVGGAYLRGGFTSELAKCLLVHGSQLAHAARLATTRPWVLLPQSIGPFTGRAQTRISRWLGRATAVFLRDDKSARELAALRNTHRVGDSAVLAIGSARSSVPADLDRGAAPAARGLILRALPSAGDYEDRARALLAAAPWVPIVQSARGGNNDVLFYERLGVTAELSLADAVRRAGIGTCTSVRLHGALEAILLGVPAVHLSYERKGFAAYGDLGLSEFVFDARTADPTAVLAAVAAIEADPAAFWTALKTTADERSRQRDLVIATLAAARPPAPGSSTRRLSQMESRHPAG